MRHLDTGAEPNGVDDCAKHGNYYAAEVGNEQTPMFHERVDRGFQFRVGCVDHRCVWREVVELPTHMRKNLHIVNCCAANRQHKLALNALHTGTRQHVCTGRTLRLT